MEKISKCPFCHPQQDSHQHIVFENDTCYFLQHDGHQDVLEGSGVIVPKEHRQTTFDLSLNEWTGIYELLHQVKSNLDERFHPDGYTLGWNVGLVSNQTIPHAHFHVVPRYTDEPYAGKGLRYWLKQEDNRRIR
ncbi:HIT family protein [Alicyclobacillus sp. SO9]|uniref:HIT family protein n=1 Tax=Alicyclobacillus sp. SO9 TaxID=2665646 RepID=UPI0018E84FEB|nr:HIT family protein [Alicyclobacillus sp. SO9]QQE77104.1 HIT family protein [Alicyclobacillus sp. SO9]